MDWEATVRKLMLADTSDLVELARIAGRDPKTFYVDANFRGARVTAAERAALGLPHVPLESVGSENDIHSARIAEVELELSSVSRKDHPQLWASLIVRLGNLFHQLGLAQDDPGPLYNAQDYFKIALEEFTWDHSPQEWSETQTKLGRTLTEIGRMTGRYNVLREAIDAFRSALKERTRQEVPTKWADTQMLLGEADLILAERGRERYARAAVNAYRAALTVFDKRSHRAKWVHATYGLGMAELLRATVSRKATATPLNRFVRILSDHSDSMSEKRQLQTKTALGLALVLHGRIGHRKSLDEGMELLSTVAPRLAASRDHFRWAQARQAMAEGYLALGRYGPAEAAISDAFTFYTQRSYLELRERAGEVMTKIQIQSQDEA